MWVFLKSNVFDEVEVIVLIGIIVIVVSLLSIYWFFKLMIENRYFKNKFDVPILSNGTIKILGGLLSAFLFSEYIIILQDWDRPINNLELLYYDFMLMSNLALINKYKRIVNGLDKLSKTTK